jgi:23S rRNA (guanosine2251-2'-O)-methyltransferase
VWGVNAVRQVVAARGGLAAEVRVAAGAPGAAREIAERARRAGIPVHVGTASDLDRLARSGHHQGVVARLGAFPYAALDDVVRVRPQLVLALDCVQDPRNLGAILRTAEAAGVEGILIPKNRAAGVTPAAVMSAAGHVFRVPVALVPNLARAIDAVKADGAWAVGLDPRAPTTLYGLSLPQRLVLVAGGEGEGMRPLVQRTCDFVVSLPMAPGVDSLNASVAVGIALYEIVRHRVGSGGGGDTPGGASPTRA